MQGMCEALVRMLGPEGEVIVGLVLSTLALWKHVEARRARQREADAVLSKAEAVVELEVIKRSLPPPPKPSSPGEP
jgi:hypothetical protein